MENAFIPVLLKTAQDNGIPINTVADRDNFLEAASYVAGQEVEQPRDNPLLKSAALAIKGHNQPDPAVGLAKTAASIPAIREAITSLRKLSA